MSFIYYSSGNPSLKYLQFYMQSYSPLQMLLFLKFILSYINDKAVNMVQFIAINSKVDKSN